MNGRRSLLASVAGAAAAGAVLPVAGAQAHPDTALLAASAAYDAVENSQVLLELCRVNDAMFTPEQDAVHEAALGAELAKQDGPLLTLATTRASSVEGMRVKARVLLGMLGKDMSPPALGHVDQYDLMRSVIGDLLEGVPG